MSFAPNPPLSDTAAVYYVDLLSMLAGLRHGPALYFYDVRTVLQSTHARVPFVGGPQTTSYLQSAVFTPAVADAVAISPLFARLNLRPMRIQHLVGESLFYGIATQPEGSMIRPGVPACRISGSSFCTSLVAPLARHIWTFQTLIARQARSDDDRQRAIMSEHHGGSMVPFSIVRAHSPTLGAYAARAYVKAGYHRLNARNREDLYARVNKGLQENEWTVRSSAFRARADRRALILRTGCFSETAAEELLAGQIIGITEEEFVRNDLHGLLLEGLSKQPRTYFSDRSYVYFDPLLYEIPEAANGVLLTDSCYGTTFSPSARALYGEGVPTQGVGGTSIEEGLDDFAIVGYARAALHRIPCIEAPSMGDLIDAVGAIERVAAGPLLFRGQVNHFTVNRPASVNEILYGQADVDELSLMTASSRARFDWDHFHYRFQLQSQGLLYADLPADRFESHDVDPEGTLRFDNVEVQRRYSSWDRQPFQFEQACMGVAQHYGVPTDGLDLTSDLAIALWFATSTYQSWVSQEGGPAAWYTPLDPVAGRPVIYVICADLSIESATPIATLGGLRSLRAERQSAHLHYGGWGMHTNLCATETIAAIFLSPECVAQATKQWIEVEELFPDEKNDRLYGDLLALRSAAERIDQRWGFDRIVRYTRPG